MKLHIGGSEKKEGWRILDIQPWPDVDIVADIEDLSALEEGACSEIYASHVLEHIPYSGDRLLGVLKGLRRILAPDGVLKASVPDMDTLCWLFVSPRVKLDSKFHVMRVMFGGQVDAHDFPLYRPVLRHPPGHAAQGRLLARLARRALRRFQRDRARRHPGQPQCRGAALTPLTVACAPAG